MKLKLTARLFLILISLLNLSRVQASDLAVVYRGKGACPACYKGAAKAALAAGLRVIYVTDRLRDFSILKEAKVWIQPGGTSKTALLAMGEAYLERLRDFVAQGGGYVGFCAGAFLATAENGSTGLAGLGIVPGRTIPIFEDFSREDHPYLLNLVWGGHPRVIYFNGGPYFDLSSVNDPSLKILATYADFDHKVAALQVNFGKGKVAVSGAHPEELNAVKLSRFFKDPDGNDRGLAVEMIHSVIQVP